MSKKLQLVLLSLFFILGLKAQVVNNQCESQTPCNALPLCSNATYSTLYTYTTTAPYNVNPGGAGTCANTVGGTVAFTPNWVYFRFTCSASGGLNFAIIPNDINADMDWALWDITASGCGTLNAGNLLDCNSFNGPSGAAGTGTQAVAAVNFEPTIALTAGNTYILGVSRKSGGLITTGFSINFTGTTANLSDATQPALQSIAPLDFCNPINQIKVKMSKPIRCSQIQTVDFALTNNPVFNAVAGTPCPGCVNGAGGNPGTNYSQVTDTVVLNFPTALAPGTYTLSLQGAPPAQPFFDMCGNLANIIPTLTFTVPNPITLTLGTSLNCATQTYRDTAKATFGTGPYQYKAEGPGQTNTYGLFTFGSQIFQPLTAGTYTITAKDINNCTSSVVITHTPYITMGLLTAKKDPPCNNQFLLDTFRVANIIGGAGPFTYALTGSNAAWAAAATQYAPGAWNNLQGSASYTITVTDTWGCTATASANIVNPAVLILPTPNSTNPACFGDSSGTITCAATGGTNPVNNYAISPSYPNTVITGINNNIFNNLPAGTYTIVVTDANGCTASNTRTLTTPSQIVIYTGAAPPSKINPTCTNPCGGSIIANAVGGTGAKKFYRLPLVNPPNTYTDSVTVAGGSFLNLCAGIYTIMAKDVQGCTSTATFSLTLPPLPTLTLDSVKNVLCNGGCSGQIFTTTTGGTPAYTYAITPNNNPPCGNAVLFGSGDYQNLPNGTYKIVISDINLCKDSVQNIAITQPVNPLLVTVGSIQNILCNPLCNGTAQATGNGGTIPYSFSIVGGGTMNAATGNITNLCAGTFTVTITDANGCTASTTFSVTQPALPLSVTVSNIVNVTCNGLCNGTAQANGSGGTGAITYAITAPGVINGATGAISALCAGPYTVTATDQNGCTATTVFNITEPTVLTVNVSNIVNVTCNGLCNGTAQANGSGGTGAITYVITAPGVINGATGAISALCAGPYTVTATDQNGCTATTVFNITQPTVLTVNVSNIVNVTCNGLCNGTAQANGSGGTGAITYVITAPGVINGATGAISGLCAGTYTVTATDQNGCTATTVFNITEPTVLTVNVSNIVNVTCNGLCNGTAQANGSGGTGAITYAITAPGVINGATGAISALCAGPYTVTATDQNGCTATTVFNITEPTLLSVTVSNIVNVTCNGLCNGTAQANGSGGTGAITYAITAPGVINGAIGAISALCAGPYTVTATDQNGCTATTVFNITEPTVLTVNVSNIVNVTCNGLCNGTAQANGSGGTGAITYVITAPGVINGATGAISALCAGPYTVTATDQNGCTATTVFNITEPTVLTVNVSNIVNVTCNGLCNGTAQANGSGGTGAITYAITAPGVINGATGAISALCAGPYTVTATDQNGCTATTVFNITEPTLLSVTVSNIVNVTCNGLCNGTAQANGSGGTGAITYAITAPGVINGATGAISGLCAGSYTVTATDQNGCTATTVLNITEPSAVTVTIQSTVQPTCTPGCDGEVVVIGNGGTGIIALTITPNAGIVQNPLGTFTGLCAGTNYIITGTDANGCTGTTNITLTTPNAPTVAMSNIVNVSCNGLCDGTAQATGGAGAGGYVYAITAPGIIDPVTGAISGLCAGTYTVTVTDLAGCVGTNSFTITEPNILVININTQVAPNCNPGCNGTATVTTSGGTGAYSYTIQPSGTINAGTGASSNLCAGIIYTITVSDVNGCTSSTTIQFALPNAPTVSISNIVNVSCNGLCDGTAQATANGGAGGYTYSITAPGVINGATGAISGLCAGPYTVTVTDLSNCIGTTVFNITEPTVLTVNVSNIVNVTCNGLCNGTAQANGSGGTGAITYAITAPGVINGATGAISGLCAGPYTVTATDQNGCTATTVFNITEPTLLSVTVSNIVNVTCNGLCNGTAQANGSGGTGAITYAITAPGVINGATGAISALCAGPYTVTATDQNGCTATTVFNITEPTVLTVNVSNIVNVTCNGLCNGTAQANGSGGTGAITYVITAPGVINGATGAISALCAGPYTVTATDQNGCTATTVFNITEPTVLTVNVSNIVNVTCNGLCNGTAQANGSGGTGAITYAITAPGVINGATGAISALCAGPYTVTATDQNGCTATTVFNITEPTLLSVTVSNIVNVTCNGLCNGTAQANGSGGTGAITYAITAPGVINGATGAISGLCAGSYTVTATDQNGCTATTVLNITEPSAVTVTIQSTVQPTCTPGCDGEVVVIGNGGTGIIAFTITPNAGIVQNPLGTFTGLCAGTNYIITGTDANGCTGTTNITLTTPNAPTVAMSNIVNVSCNGLCDGTAQATGGAGAGGYVYAITAPGIIDPVTGAISGLCAGTYTVTVTDLAGCVGTNSFTITEPNILVININTQVAPNCNPGCNGTATVTTSGGTGAYSYTIQPSGTINAGTGASSNLCAGIIYTITVSDVNGCTSSTTIQFALPNAPTVSISNIVNVSCNGLCDGTAQATANGGAGGYTYSITAPGVINGATGAISGLCAGPYTVTVTDLSNCIGTTVFNITEPTVLTVNVSNIVNVTCNGLCNGTAQANGSGGTGAITYAITAPGVINGATGAISALCAGPYTVTATDQNGCTATTVFTITEPSAVTVTIQSTVQPTCTPGCDGEVVVTGNGGIGIIAFTITPNAGIVQNPLGTFTGLCAGTNYIITGTDANGCTGTTNITLTTPNAPTVAMSNIVNVSCNGLCDGTAQATGGAGAGGYVYAITAPGIIDPVTGAISGLCAGTYTVTVTDQAGCVGTNSFTITEPSTVTVTIQSTVQPTCTPGCDGEVVVIGNGGTGVIAFTITPNAGIIQNPLGTFTGLCAGTNYIITGTDANGCTSTTNITLTTPNAPTVAMSNIVNVSCNGLCDGTAQATANGGAGGYTYSITAPGVINGATGAISGLCAGPYTVTVTDLSNCIGTTVFNITEPTVLTVNVSNIVNVTCNGLCNGTAQANGSGGTGAITYAITAPGVINGATGAISALCAGPYTVTATDQNGCTATTVFNITEPTLLSVTVSNIVNVTCNGLCNGTAQANGSGGTGAITYAITAPGVINGATGAISGLCAGSYTVTATDQNGCTATTVLNITEPSAVTVTIQSTVQPTCTPGCDGEVVVIGNGGTGIIALTITPNAGIVQNPLGTFTGLCAGTNYIITGTDANGCTGTTNITLTTPNAPTVAMSNIVNVSCNGLCDGTAQATGGAGAGGYVYAITAPGIIDPATGAISGLCAGTYTVTVTDQAGCVGTNSFTITEPSAVTVTIQSTVQPTCTPGCDGEVVVIGNGGIGIIAFTITPNAGIIQNPLGTFTGLCAGTNYIITGTDANGCTGTTNITLTTPNAPTVAMSNIVNVSCNGLCDGTAQATGGAGAGGYVYAITAPGIIDPVTGAISGLCAGTYTVTVTDQAGCVGTNSFTITEPSTVTVTIQSTVQPTCTPGCDGEVVVIGNGGTGVIAFTITPNAGIIQNPLGTFTGLCAGTNYIITGTDANGCTGTTNITLTTPNAPTVAMSNIVNVSCNGLCDGTAQATGGAGAGGYVYAITAPGIIDPATGAISGLCAGTYTVTVTDQAGCVGTNSFTITEPSAVTVTIQSTVQPTCTPGCDGEVVVTGNGGIGIIAFTITPNAGIVQNPLGTFTGLCAGTNYIITGTDANGCTGTTNITLTTPNAPTVAMSNIVNVSCNGLCDGTAQATGGAGAGGYVYAITAPGIIDPATGAISGLCAGTYTVTVTDQAGCVGTNSFTITEPTVLTVTIPVINNVTMPGGNNGDATALAVGGTGPYTYTISPLGPQGPTGFFINLTAQCYTVVATDANGCTASETFCVTEPIGLVLNLNSTDVSCFGVCDGTITSNVLGGTPPFNFVLSPLNIPNATGFYSGLCAGAYTVTVTDANNNTASETIIINSPTQIVFANPTIVNPICLPNNTGSIDIIANGGNGGITYTINPLGPQGPSGLFTALTAGVYTITATDINTCFETVTVTLVNPNAPILNITNISNVTCNGLCDGSAQANAAGGGGNNTFSIQPAGFIDPTTGVMNGLCAGTYTVTVTDINFCATTASFIIVEPQILDINIGVSTNPTCQPGCDGTATTFTTGGTMPYSYAISGGANINLVGTASVLCANIVYTITVTDANNCTASTTIILIAPNGPTLNITNINNVTCFGLCNGTAQANVVGGGGGNIFAITAPGIINGTGNISNLCAGAYTVTVTDINACTATVTFSITEPPLLQIMNITATGIACDGLPSGSLTVDVSGGSLLYTVNINPNPPTANTPLTGASPLVITGLTPNTYTVTVTDANGCTATSTAIVNGSTPIVFNNVNITNISCFGQCNGAVSLTTNGGVLPINYTINPAAVQGPLGTFTALCAGTYTVTATDANLCTSTVSFTITEPTVLQYVTASGTDPLCAGDANGTIIVDVTGGTGGYAYGLNPANGLQAPVGTFTGLVAWVYTVTAMDANGCTVTTQITLNDPASIVWTNTTANNISCNGSGDGSISVTAGGGVGNYVYTITPLGPQPNQTGIYQNLSAQCYTVTATDANGCSITTVLCITEPPVLSLGVPVTTNALCFGDQSGSITIGAIGGNPIPNYTYVLQPGGQSNTTGVFGNVGAGTYAVTVTDGSGCTAIATGIVINQPMPVVYNTVNINNIYCYGEATGSVAVVASGGTGNILFSINPAATQFPLGFFKDLYAGSYVITATDANGCTATTQVTVTQNPALTFTSISTVEPICSYDSTGIIFVTATGGTSPILYSLNNGTPRLNGTFTGLTIAQYKVTLIDDLGCSKDTMIYLGGPSPVGADITLEDAKCVDSKDGRLIANGTGGRGGYKYYVTPGLRINKTGRFYDLAPGTYTLRVVDTVGCEYQTEFTINPPQNPLSNTMTKVNLICLGKGNEGSATANAYGGQPPYVYEWSTSPVQNTPTASNLYYGWYNVLITDAYGCTIHDTVYVEEGPCCEVSFIPNAFSPNGDNTNDEFRVLTTAGTELIQFEVYDRWGQRLWSSSDYRRGWDGTIDGKEAGVGTYFYIYKYRCTRDGEIYVKKGDVTLIR